MAVFHVDFIASHRDRARRRSVVLDAVAGGNLVSDNTPMQRKSAYPYTVTAPPGCNVHKYRQALGWSQRTLADRCKPELDHTTVRRVEQNDGYTQDTLERIAAALGVTVSDLFLPHELADYASLPKSIQKRIADTVQDAAKAHRYENSA